MTDRKTTTRTTETTTTTTRAHRRAGARWLRACVTAALPVACGIAIPTTTMVAAGCGGPGPRFALRAPLTREPERPFAHRPDRRADLNAPNAVDASVFGPISRALTFRPDGEALNVNALDEVPDSSWFTNRGEVSPELAAQGPCRDAPPPAAPFTLTSGKIGGSTPGFFARDALGRRFALKLDMFPREQPELSTAADAIVSRLYWLVGYNVPCNNVVDVRPAADLRIAPNAHLTNEFGHHIALTRERALEQLGRGVPRAGGAVRVGASLFVDGEPIGPFAIEGRRGDDPNDRVAHEERRELRGERLLAAWVNHWDSREPNALDTFVRVGGDGGAGGERGGGPTAAAGQRAGLVRHYLIDFGDTLGGRSLDAARNPRLGNGYTINPGETIVDFATFGVIRRPWDEAHANLRAPVLWNFDAGRFDPRAWVPGTPVVRFQRATDADMGWMARRIARVSPAHLRALVRTGQLTDPVLEHELLRALIARRERILRWSFAHTSPLDAIAMVEHDRLCAQDLGLATGVSEPRRTAFAARIVRRGDDALRDGPVVALARGARPGELCATLPPHGAYPAGTPDDAAARYVTLEIARSEGRDRTRLRAHLYDLGPERGYALVGIER